ncbi:DUF4390 domain-containing protein [Pseudorhodoferax sp.]|uniref:DUF4390 domain-containing protein n=1 Tax=Pseudorhodoferax sp. TaxID=1993553 RepID=UPI002DD63430|nr:DUF4390 domain-containing protein [Pseudorhodoferax sp.]
MTTTVFFTVCWRKAWASLSLALLLACGWAQAQAPAPGTAAITQLLVQRVDGELELSADVQFELSPQVEDALHKGIPMFFVAEVEIVRERWYWTDKLVASATRHMRLAYQPLTRRWRLNVGPRPIDTSGLGVTLAQTFDSLPEALASVQRLARWQIAHTADIPADSAHQLRFRFALDVSQLPRPFQIGAVGQSEWSIAASASMKLPAEGAK